MNDYYYILGIRREASADEIRTAHRKLSKKFHPDLNPNDSHSHKMFMDIQEAYECLLNDSKRKTYDMAYAAWINTKDKISPEKSRDSKIELDKSKSYIKKIQKKYLIISVLISVIAVSLIYQSDMQDKHVFLITIPLFFILIYLYFIPSIIAWNKNHEYRQEICILNIFSAFTLLLIPLTFIVFYVCLLLFSINRVTGVNAFFVAIIGLLFSGVASKSKRK